VIENYKFGIDRKITLIEEVEVHVFFLYEFQILSRARLQELVREVDPAEQLDEEVEELLLQLADDFVENAVNAACLFAKHRRANTIDVKDVQLHLGTYQFVVR